MKHLFLILNYNTIDMTCELCNFLNENNYDVVVVENGSLNFSKEDFEKKLCYPTRVDLVVSKDNVGFAKGNNLGYQHIKKKYDHVDFIHCINSDIEFIDINSFIKTLNKIKCDDLFLIGPNILNNGYKSSPMYARNIKMIKQEVLSQIDSINKKILKHKIGSLFGKYYYNYMKQKNSFVQTKDYEASIESCDEFLVFQGSYLIFTNNYFDYYSSLFNDKTFLYHEEDLLFLKLFLNKQKVLYVDELIINHLEGQSTNSNVVFKYQQMKNSLLILKEEVDNCV